MVYEEYYKPNLNEIKRLRSVKLKLVEEQISKIKETYSKETVYNGKEIRRTVFISLIQKWNNKIIERVFAVKKKKEIEYQEVKRAVVGNSYILSRNIYTNWYGTNTIVVWSKKEAANKSYYFYPGDFDKWSICDIKEYNITAVKTYSNEDIAKLDDKYKYCNYDNITYIIHYLSMYNKQPKLEMLSKIEFTNLLNNTNLVKKLDDKKFCKWLYKQSVELQDFEKRQLTGTDVIYAYNHNISPVKAHSTRQNKLALKGFTNIYPQFDVDKTINYLISKNVSVNLYKDLIDALVYLKLDLTDTKNIYPNDFQYWHDFYTKQVTIDKNKNTDLMIKNQCEKYSKLIQDFSNDLVLLFPHNTNDFIEEGNALHHCVGRMGYNNKMANGETLIIFVRKKENVNKPFVTMEYNQHTKKVLQLYAENDTTPEDYVKSEIYNIWLPKAEKMIFAK